MRMFFGSCQDVSGNDWWGNPQAPWNEPPMVQCPDCGGDGGVYEAGSESITPDEYDKLPKEEQEWYCFVPCKRCDGSGEIVENYEEC